jgi:hypothetical protein
MNVELLTRLEELDLKLQFREFTRWEEHYRSVLQDMYTRYVDPSFNLSYMDFAEMAYDCTVTEWNTKQHKQSRPLL